MNSEQFGIITHHLKYDLLCFFVLNPINACNAINETNYIIDRNKYQLNWESENNKNMN